jgi:carbamoyl-phosphate synthase large subunit
VSVKESVFPFNRFPGADIILGPEMKSTGEVMGMDEDFGRAFAKSQLAAGQLLPTEGTVFVSVRDTDKHKVYPSVKRLYEMGFRILATPGTSQYLAGLDIPNRPVNKIAHGRPHVIDHIKNGDIQLVINTPSGVESAGGSHHIRRAVIQYGIPYATTLSGAAAMTSGIEALRRGDLVVRSLQEYHRHMSRPSSLPPLAHELSAIRCAQ